MYSLSNIIIIASMSGPDDQLPSFGPSRRGSVSYSIELTYVVLYYSFIRSTLK